MPLRYYELREVEIEDTGAPVFLTAALIICSLCGDAIDGMGGPGHGPVCLRCADVVLRGGARGAIKWDVTNMEKQSMTTAETLIAQWNGRERNPAVGKNPSFRKIVEKLSPSVSIQTGVGTTTYTFPDGSRVKVQGRGKNHTVILVQREAQAA